MSSMRRFVGRLFSSRKRAILIIVAVGVFAGAGWWIVRKPEPSPQYQTATVERETVVSTVTASGRVLMTSMTSVTTTATGVVKEVFVHDGDTVRARQTIAEIVLDSEGQEQHAQAWSSYLSAKNTLDAADVTLYTLQSDMFTKWDTFKALAESSSYQNADGSPRSDQRTLPAFHIAEKNWLAAEAKYKNQRAVIAQAKAALSFSWLSYQSTSPTITAPTAGTVATIVLTKGLVLSAASSASDQTTSSQRVAVIRQDAVPLVTVSVSEADAARVQVGQKATVLLDSISEKTFTGSVVTVDRIGTIANNVTSYPVTIRLDTATPEVLSNMAVTATIITESRTSVLVVPSGAIQTQEDQSFVRVLRDGQAQDVAVDIGISSDTKTEIISGLSEGDEVITGTVSTGQSQQGATSMFGGGFGGGAFRTGGFGGRR